MSNIIDSIQLSGSSYDVRDKSATTVVEITQSDYDNLPSSAKTSNILYIITDGSVDYITSAQCQTQINNSISGKQDTLVSGTNIKTINNESLLGSGNIDIQGGGGKAIEAGRGIKITTGETADTVSLNVIGDYYGTVDLATRDRSVYNGSIMIGRSYIDNRDHAIAIGTTKSGINGGAKIYGNGGIGIGNNVIERSRFGIVIGSSSSAGTSDMQFSCCAIGMQAESYGQYSTALSRTKVNNESEFGCGKYNVSNTGSTEADNTLFSVGNGTSDSARHNAFEIRQNGDIYLSLNGQDVKLQDQLGGGGSSYSAGTGIDITNDVISVSGVVMSSAITTNITSSSTDAQVPSAKAVNDKLGGLSIVKLTQAQYDSLATKDNSTLYVIVN